MQVAKDGKNTVKVIYTGQKILNLVTLTLNLVANVPDLVTNSELVPDLVTEF